ncbi:MAG: pyridoxal phosphate-dependent aminotransferase [Spirochaetales bacterium]|nr:pyridoxal phosphate-dependent aminotransferase [Spirochaetales bacterium]
MIHNPAVDRLFDDREVDRDLLRRKAYNYRWAEHDGDVIPLTAADPDFRAPEAVREAIAEYAREGYFSYGPKTGLPEFIDAVVDTMRTRRGIDVERELVLPIDSAARAMFVMARTVLEPGDEAIIFDPVDYLFRSAVEAAGGAAVHCPVDGATGEPDLSRLPELVTPRTRMIGVCNPHNPLGRLLRRREVEEIALFAERYKLWIMNDEIWSDILYGDVGGEPGIVGEDDGLEPDIVGEDDGAAFVSMHALEPALRRRTVTIYGFSKAFALAGLRAAFVLCPDHDTYDRFVSAADLPSTAGGVATLSQVAATAALRLGWEWVERFVTHLRGQRDYAVARLNALHGVRCSRPEGTYVLFPDVSAFGLSSKEIADHALTTGRVAVVPGTPDFFGPRGEGHIRLCFSTSRGVLAEGLDRLEAALSALHR